MADNVGMAKPVIRTIGHSTRPVEALIEMLKAHGVKRVLDVRTIPKSRYNPQYNSEALERSLCEAGIGYEHMKALGGLRHPRKDSPNTGWRNESFRGYADYMETQDFRKGIERLLEVARNNRVAIMCSEAVWWRCHRSMISDYLKVQGIEVVHIMGEGKSELHPFTSAAQVVNGELSYRGVLTK